MAYREDLRSGARKQLGFAFKDISEHLPGAFIIYRADTDDDDLFSYNIYVGKLYQKEIELHFRLLNRSLKGTYTTEQLLHTLKDIKFTDIEEQGFMPVYKRQEITDDLHETCGFRTDYQFITKRKMKEIQKKSKRR